MVETASDLPLLPAFILSAGGIPGWGWAWRSIVCSHKYTKLAAYRLISVHDPSEIFLCAFKGCCLVLAPHIPVGLTESGGALIKLLFRDNKATASSSS